jgi:excisionase family DNA binding protein
MVFPALYERPIAADEQTVAAAQELRRMLTTARTEPIQLVLPTGESLAMPAAVEHALQEVVSVLADGDAVAVLQLHQHLTTNQAARLLDVSRPTLIALLERGDIPYSKNGTHRRIRLTDVLAYKQQREQEAAAHLDAILVEAQESGSYF